MDTEKTINHIIVKEKYLLFLDRDIENTVHNIHKKKHLQMSYENSINWKNDFIRKTETDKQPTLLYLQMGWGIQIFKWDYCNKHIFDIHENM